jgi:DNA-binding transcriptional LysR family regulator
VPEVLCGAWFDSGALVRIFPIELPTHDTYFLVNRVKDSSRPEVLAMTDWARTNCLRLPSPESAMSVGHS